MSLMMIFSRFLPTNLKTIQTSGNTVRSRRKIQAKWNTIPRRVEQITQVNKSPQSMASSDSHRTDVYVSWVCDWHPLYKPWDNRAGIKISHLTTRHVLSGITTQPRRIQRDNLTESAVVSRYSDGNTMMLWYIPWSWIIRVSTSIWSVSDLSLTWDLTLWHCKHHLTYRIQKRLNIIAWVDFIFFWSHILTIIIFICCFSFL